MLIGSTFAWFTDSVKAGKNTITAGNLKIQVNKTTDLTNWTEVGEEDELFGENVLWEPGHVEFAVINVKNVGDMAVEYKLSINAPDEGKVFGKNAANQNIDLARYLKFAAFEIPKDGDVRKALKAIIDKDTTVIKGDLRATLRGIIDTNNLGTDLSVGAQYKGQLKGSAKGNVKDTALNTSSTNETNPIMIVVYMPTDVTDEANYRGDVKPSIELGLNVEAKQYTYEEDAFNNQYDKNAEPDYNVISIPRNIKLPSSIQFTITDDGWGNGGEFNLGMGG